MNFKISDGIDKTDEQNVSSRKKTYIAVAVVVALITVGFASYSLAKKNTHTSSSPYSANVEVKRDACKLFALDDAKKILGNKTAASSTNANAITATVTTSLCSYSSNDTDTSKLKVVTVLIRSTNQIQARQAFELSRATNSTKVEKLGSEAYYNPDTSQLNILSGVLLIRIASTEGTAGRGTTEIPTKVGQVITSRL